MLNQPTSKSFSFSFPFLFFFSSISMITCRIEFLSFFFPIDWHSSTHDAIVKLFHHYTIFILKYIKKKTLSCTFQWSTVNVLPNSIQNQIAVLIHTRRIFFSQWSTTVYALQRCRKRKQPLQTQLGMFWHIVWIQELFYPCFWCATKKKIFF